MSNFKFLENRSILLGKILRHNPPEINLNHDKYGWFKVEDVLKVLKVNENMLKKIVSFGKKTRYVYNEEETEIRALQGHSFSVDLLMEASMPPKILYHGTIIDVKGVILRTGLSKMGRQHVHLSSDLKTAKTVAKRRKKPIVVFSIDTLSMINNDFDFYQAENGVWLVDAVPAQYLREVKL